ncbi:CoA transferase [Xylophilus sp. GOD-11R]|uniref:CaiB/BaiF CoA transferase family protein n=1 Tax=Xylophilus sp. GOD-11R TaxID=3089814 RepID=UPI00298CE30C|nr:CoA transferase [Xylophilus sp. GOD-11R]WPB55872.1 CoA transferase [Xylophilus sp. GOD-11R]
MAGPLKGIKILDLTSVVMGPYATQIFGDFGADVIKVESPDGDIMRHMGAAKRPAMGPIHVALNRNKRSLMLDLRQPTARETLLKLAATADVFVHSMRPDAIERLGLTYDALKAVKPDIVYCGAYGYGKAGPYALEPAYDDMIQGMCGMASINQHLAGEPRFTPTIVGDKVSGLTIAYSVLAALFHRSRTGEGQSIEVPMFESMVSFMMIEHLWERAFDRENGAAGYPRVMSQLRKPHRTSDGYVCMLPYTDRNWKDFFALAGRPDLAAEPRYATATSRSQNYETLYATLGEIISGNTTAHWLKHCGELSIPVAPVNSLDDLFSDPHLEAVGTFFTAEHPTLGKITQVKPPVNFSATPSEVRTLAPRLGQHSQEILSDAGFTPEEIAVLVAAGATAA